MKDTILSYCPPNKQNWQGRTDSPHNSQFFQIVQLRDLSNDVCKFDPQIKNFALLGFCCDEGVRRNLGRVGAASGPAALRAALAKFPIHNKNFAFYDVGDIICVDGNLEEAQKKLSEVVSFLLAHNVTPIVIGGGHEIAWGHYQGIVKQFSQEKIGIINFDAHLDMRPLLQDGKGSSGTPFLQIAQDCADHSRNFDYNCIGVQSTGNTRQLFETAKKYHVNTVFAEELHTQPTQSHIKTVDRILEANDIVYTTICLDVFSVAYAPGVSAVQPLGLCPWQVIPLLRRIAKTQKIVTYDIAELCPQYDPDQRTAKLAASFVFEIIHSALDAFDYAE